MQYTMHATRESIEERLCAALASYCTRLRPAKVSCIASSCFRSLICRSYFRMSSCGSRCTFTEASLETFIMRVAKRNVLAVSSNIFP